MWLALGTLCAGALLLYLGGEFLVSGAAGLALAFGLSPLAVGLTVVAYGTSAPEAVVSTLATVRGDGALVLGNVVGSNVANLGLILGAVTCISPPTVDPGLARRELTLLLGTSLLLVPLLLDGRISRLEGAGLCLGALAFTLWVLRGTHAASSAHLVPPKEAPPSKTQSRAALIARALAGLALLLGGGQLFVDGASTLALTLGMSPRVVGLTIVAVGTSLPELVTSLVASAKGHSDLAVGNILGSNLFNVLFILGLAGVVRPVAGTLDQCWFDVAALLGLTAAASLMLLRPRRLTRAEGLLLLAGYAAFVTRVVLS